LQAASRRIPSGLLLLAGATAGIISLSVAEVTKVYGTNLDIFSAGMCLSGSAGLYAVFRDSV
jgi:hypothetical protein